MKVDCYICKQPVEVDHIDRHLRSHTDEDTYRAQRQVIRERRSHEKSTEESTSGLDKEEGIR